EERQDQQRGVEVLRPVAARVATFIGVEAPGSYLVGDCVALCPPAFASSSRASPPIGDAKGAVECKPGHQLRVDVLPRVVAYLPDAGIGFAPMSCDMIGKAAHGPPHLGGEGVTVS